ncbi:phosphate transporter [Zychaea mexicana]|uniref:phosphate transporter n=1 Tax=Zychaea mexicana TaxID=64656 RepID=UPI0022FE0A5E|nr:phosphate transporter [Zychaea mexicana]KAI9498298.1 phosphate transporter [Zychaea mexicana]
MMDPYDFTWIFGVGMVVAFTDAYGIGANDVANSFASSISSGSLTLVQAVIIACFTEFLGALLLGSGVTSTIKNGIIEISLFDETPEMLMMGMMCALIGSSTWVLTATRFGWPVSTTHSIIGAICGFGIAGFGGSAVDWTWDGIIQIVVSWFLSPCLAGAIAAIIYLITKYTVLRQVDSVKWGLRLVPVYFFVTVFVIVLYVCFKAPGAEEAELPISHIIGIALGCGGAIGIYMAVFLCPWLKRVVVDREDVKWYHIPIIWWVPKQRSIEEGLQAAREELEEAAANDQIPKADDEEKLAGDDHTSKKLAMEDADAESKSATEQEPSSKTFGERLHQIKDRVLAVLLHGIRQDVRNLNNDKLKKMHAAAEVYDDDVEFMFSYLQILTAIVASFAHGSNDVSNAVGPLATIYDIWQRGTVGTESTVPIWVLAYGGAAIDIGLATMGYRLMRAMGNNITRLTPSRGFAAELGAALTVLTASQLSLPVSTTHCMVGATVGVGLCNGNLRAVNWKMLALTFFGWICTLPVAGLVSGLIYAFCAYGPSFVYLR